MARAWGCSRAEALDIVLRLGEAATVVATSSEPEVVLMGGRRVVGTSCAACGQRPVGYEREMGVRLVAEHGEAG